MENQQYQYILACRPVTLKECYMIRKVDVSDTENIIECNSEELRVLVRYVFGARAQEILEEEFDGMKNDISDMNCMPRCAQALRTIRDTFIGEGRTMVQEQQCASFDVRDMHSVDTDPPCEEPDILEQVADKDDEHEVLCFVEDIADIIIFAIHEGVNRRMAEIRQEIAMKN